MKNYKLLLVNSKNKLLNFKVIEPETPEEAMNGINDSMSEDGMILFPIKPEITVCLDYVQHYKHIPLDIISVDWHGNIKYIDENVQAEERPTLYTNSVCIIELKAGLCGKYGINIGDTVIHEKLKFLPTHKISFQCVDFEKATPKELKELNPNDILFFGLINVTRNDMLYKTALLITKFAGKECRKYYVDWHSEYYKSLLTKVFPAITDKSKATDFNVIEMEYMNQLFVRKDCYDKFIELLGNEKIDDNWIPFAEKIACD